MSQVIIYMDDETGILAVIHPTAEALESHTMEEIAEKDVPEGNKYKIISVDDIPTDRTFRNAWEADEADLTDGVGGQYTMFITDPQHPDYVAPETAE